MLCFKDCFLTTQIPSLQRRKQRGVLIRWQRMSVRHRYWEANGACQHFHHQISLIQNFSVFRANQTLLDLKVTTDPPPQFRRLGTTGAAVRGGPVAPGTCRYGLYSCSFKLTSHEDGDMEVLVMPHIPARFRSFQQIPVPFQWNLPAKISLLPRNFDIPVISLEQSPELTGMEWHWNAVTGMNTKNCQIW